MVRTEHTVWKGATCGGSGENDEMLSSSDLVKRIRCLNGIQAGVGAAQPLSAARSSRGRGAASSRALKSEQAAMAAW
jgi:hypothetical protein